MLAISKIEFNSLLYSLAAFIKDLNNEKLPQTGIESFSFVSIIVLVAIAVLFLACTLI